LLLGFLEIVCFFIGEKLIIWYNARGPQGACRDDKGLEICTAGLEFESGRAPLIRAWDSRSFICSPGPTKYAFQGWSFPRIQKKNVNI